MYSIKSCHIFKLLLPVRFQSALNVNFIVTSTVRVDNFSNTIDSNLAIYLGLDPN